MAEEVTETYFDIPMDRYKCITVRSKKVHFGSDQEFQAKLKASIERWQEDGVRGLWVKADIRHASLVPICTQMGFVFHHAQEKYVMMKMWLSRTEPDNLPGYANQCLGCAGFVVNDKNQVLAIQEKFHLQKHWKLPGGIADAGEDVGEAACRETFEETGIRCAFQGVICFRHQHQFRHGCSDFYFICLLKPLNQDIKKCDNEIALAQWMDLDEYINHPDITDANRYFAQCYLDLKQKNQLVQAEPVLAHTKKSYTLVYGIKSWDEVASRMPALNADSAELDS